jgi:hypothetical protein
MVENRSNWDKAKATWEACRRQVGLEIYPWNPALARLLRVILFVAAAAVFCTFT